MFLGVEGLIGAGKSDFARRLATMTGIEYMGEQYEDNPLLVKFYEDKKRYSFSVQIAFLTRRFHQHQQAVWNLGHGIPYADLEVLEPIVDSFGGQVPKRESALWAGVIQDRTIYADSIFVRMLVKQGDMGEDEANEYFNLFALMRHFLDVPDGVIYLDVKPEVAHQRIMERDRSMESKMELGYLVDLHEEYERLMGELEDLGVSVLRVQWNDHLNEQNRYGRMYELLPQIFNLRRGTKNRLRRSARQL